MNSRGSSSLPHELGSFDLPLELLCSSCLLDSGCFHTISAPGDIAVGWRAPAYKGRVWCHSLLAFWPYGRLWWAPFWKCELPVFQISGPVGFVSFNSLASSSYLLFFPPYLSPFSLLDNCYCCRTPGSLGWELHGAYMGSARTERLRGLLFMHGEDGSVLALSTWEVWCAPLWMGKLVFHPWPGDDTLLLVHRSVCRP